MKFSSKVLGIGIFLISLCISLQPSIIIFVVMLLQGFDQMTASYAGVIVLSVSTLIFSSTLLSFLERKVQSDKKEFLRQKRKNLMRCRCLWKKTLRPSTPVYPAVLQCINPFCSKVHYSFYEKQKK